MSEGYSRVKIGLQKSHQGSFLSVLFSLFKLNNITRSKRSLEKCQSKDVGVLFNQVLIGVLLHEKKMQVFGFQYFLLPEKRKRKTVFCFIIIRKIGYKASKRFLQTGGGVYGNLQGGKITYVSMLNYRLPCYGLKYNMYKLLAIFNHAI